MTLALAALIVSLQTPNNAATQSPATLQANEVTVASYKIAGRDVPAKFPAVQGPFADGSGVEFNGSKYLFRNGKLVRRVQANGGWSEFAKGYESAKSKISPTTPEWRVKAFILERFDTLDRGADGVLRQRRKIFESWHTDHILESLARFAAMAEAASGGAIKIRFETEFDTDYARYDATRAQNQLAHPLTQYLRDYVGPRINGGLFEAEDRIYRGPWDSVFIIHSGLLGAAPDAIVYDAPVSPISFYQEGTGVGPYALSTELFNRWTGHLQDALAHHGFRLPAAFSATGHQPATYLTTEEAAQKLEPIADPQSLFPQSLWGKVFNRTDPTTAELIAHGTILPAKDGLNWSEVGMEKLWNLPRLDASALSAMTGADVKFTVQKGGFKVEIGTPASESREFLDGVLEFANEAMAVAPFGDKQLLIVDPEFVDFIGSKLKASLSPRVFGWVWIEGRPFVVFVTAKSPPGTTGAGLFDVPASELPAPKPSEGPIVFGIYRVAPSTDSQHLSFEINAGGFPRRGGVWLLGQPMGPAINTLKKEGFISLWIKSSHPEPMVLKLHSKLGPSKVVHLFGAMPPPAELQMQYSPLIADIPPDADWKQLVLPLSMFFETSTFELSGVTIESDPYAGFWEMAQPTTLAILTVAKPEFPDTAPSEITKTVQPPAITASAESTGQAQRELFAASVKAGADAATLQSLLKLAEDPRDEVRISVADAYCRVKDAAAIPFLVAYLRGLNHRTADVAAKALAFQDTDAAWAELKRTAEIMPSDFSREFAVRELARKKDVSIRALFTPMAFRSSWRARLAGAEAMGALEGPDAAKLLMLFVKNSDPAVRLAATQNANVEVDDACRALLFGSVNDESDLVRFTSCWRLMSSQLPAYAAEGQKGVRDDSKWVRLMLLQAMAEHPSETFRGALRLAVTDQEPEVRAAALRAFTVFPGKVEPAEVQNTAADPDPRVQEAYKKLAEAKGFLLTRELTKTPIPSYSLRTPAFEPKFGSKGARFNLIPNPSNLSVRILSSETYVHR